MNGATWTETEDSVLKTQFAKGDSDDALSGLVNRSLNSIRARRVHLKLVRSRAYRWDEERISALTRMWMAGDKLALITAKVGCSDQTARNKAYDLDLPKRTTAKDWNKSDHTKCKLCGADLISICPVPRCPHGSTLVEPAPYPEIKSSMGMI